ncbi:MAG: hypothetical protein N2Z76_02745 [Treponemataceae bacterium]|nr:hypothetical protein [Treponemataceae bacterium]
MTSGFRRTSHQTFPLRRFIMRAVLVCGWIALGAYIFVTYRAHTLLLDNKGIPGKGLAALSQVRIQIDTQKPIELGPNERDKITVVGRKHRVVITGKEQITPLVEKDITLEIGPDMYLLSLPALVAGAEDAITPFVQQVVQPKEEEVLSPETSPF